MIDKSHPFFLFRKKTMNFEEKTKNQGTSQPEASQEVNGDMAKEWEELVELDDVQLATVVGGLVERDGYRLLNRKSWWRHR
jgi:hypothetical protein